MRETVEHVMCNLLSSLTAEHADVVWNHIDAAWHELNELHRQLDEGEVKITPPVFHNETMIHNDNLSLVEEVIAEWRDADKMFTAYDVSKEVQNRGGDQRHTTMRDAVHDAVIREAPAYARTMVQMAGAPSGCWLYHPTTGDPYSHQGVTTPAPAPAPVFDDGDDDDDDDGDLLDDLAAAVPSPSFPQPADGDDGDA